MERARLHLQAEKGEKRTFWWPVQHSRARRGPRVSSMQAGRGCALCRRASTELLSLLAIFKVAYKKWLFGKDT